MFFISYPYGATPISKDEFSELIPDFISTMAELDELEQKNIAEAILWTESVLKNSDVLDYKFILMLHEKMFCNVWKWAGKFRKSNKNIGCDWPQISIKFKVLLEDVKYWVDNSTYPLEEIAVRLHFRIVSIHLFPNGNGRHARLITDLFLLKHNSKPFSWGGMQFNGTNSQEIRKEYISSLRQAESNFDFSRLLNFVGS